MKLFRGFSRENIENLHKIYRNKCIIMGQQERQGTGVTGKTDFYKNMSCTDFLSISKTSNLHNINVFLL